MSGGEIAGLIALLAIFWILPSVLVAHLAQRKGQSWVVFFLLSLFVSWVLMAVIALVLRDKSAGSG